MAVLGASGIIGQHMRLCVPPGVTPTFFRRHADQFHVGIDLDDLERLHKVIEVRFDAIVNLAGENRPDVVEQDPESYRFVNIGVPLALARSCDRRDLRQGHYVHVSTQAVFDGVAPPYGPHSPRTPINTYGRQKSTAELLVAQQTQRWTIVRATFVLGLRPFQFIGRRNPLEDMLENPEQRQVMDRWFSVLFARDAATLLWEIALGAPRREILHLGCPGLVSRYDLARRVQALSCPGVEENGEPVRDGCRVTVTGVSNDTFAGIAPRPTNTMWATGSLFCQPLEEGLRELVKDWKGRKAMDLPARARELALFLGIPESEAVAKLSRGFSPAHTEVAEDFRAANPQTDAELLAWYRRTETYLWELSAYHLDAWFNYAGMCQGIRQHLCTRMPGARVLCLADGIADLTIALTEGGLDAVYHDLKGSMTARFARFRLEQRLGEPLGSRALPVREIYVNLTEGWEPVRDAVPYDAVVALDFFEHLPNVEDWARAAYDLLRPGGVFLAQNAFAIGDAEHGGSIPCHLSRNNRFEKDWDPLLDAIGFVRDVDETGAQTGWRKKP